MAAIRTAVEILGLSTRTAVACRKMQCELLNFTSKAVTVVMNLDVRILALYMKMAAM
jgi:hypothetical protein